MPQEIIGFTEQEWLGGQCGQHALVHALLLLGIPISLKDAHRATGVQKWKVSEEGTDEVKIKKGLKYYKCNPIVFNLGDSEKAKIEIDKYLDLGYPIIICVESDTHWAVLGGKSGNNYIWIDSNHHKIIGVCDWEEVKDWFILYKKDIPKYYGIACSPKDDAWMKHSIVSKFNKIKDMLQKNKTLREYWGYYLEDMRDIFDLKDNGSGIISSNDFFSKYSTKLYESMMYWCDDTEESIWDEISNYAIVANSHGFFMSKESETQAVLDISAALAYLSVYGE